MSGYKRIGKEIKEEVIERAKTGIKVTNLSKEYGISTKTIYGWLSGTANNGESQLELIKLRRQNETLLKLVGELTLEKTQIKKNRGG